MILIYGIYFRITLYVVNYFLFEEKRERKKRGYEDTLVHSGIEKGIFELRREKKTKISKNLLESESFVR